MYKKNPEKKTRVTEDVVELRNKSNSLKIDIKKKSEKYNSGGGTPELLSKLSIYPKEFNIESTGTATHGTQAKVDYARIRTQSQHTIDIVRKKEKIAGNSSLNNEVKKSQSIKKHADYEKIKTHLSLPFYTENRHSGNETYSRLKKNGDLESHSNFIQNNSSSDEGINYIFHQTRNIVKTLNFLHHEVFLDEKEKMHKGIIHGDIKPDNILIDKNGDFSLSDFGCARYADEPIEQPGLVTYLSPELLKIYAGKIPSNNNPGKSDIWSLGLTLQSTLTGKYPIESYSQTAIDSMNTMSKDTNGYFIRELKPTPINQKIYTEKLAELPTPVDQEVYTAEELAELLADLEKLSYSEIEQEPLQVQQIRIKVDEYLQSETCKKNLESKKIIEDLCQNSSHDNMDKSDILHHITSTMLLPSEQRPTAEELSATMNKLKQYFPCDEKKNFEFVKKMIAEKENKQLPTHTQVNPILSSKRAAHKELLDQASGNGTINKVKTINIENKQPTQTQITPKLSSNRQAHKALLDQAQGVTSISSFLYSHTTPKNQTEKNKSEMNNQNPIMTIKK